MIMYKNKTDLDYHKYDIVSCDIKKKDVEEIINIYTALGYNIHSNEDSDLYLDSRHLIFYRDHILKNKDQLQYIQVNIEMKINEVSFKNQNKYIPLILISTLLIILSTGLLACGFTLIFLLSGTLYFTLSIVSFILSAILFLFITFYILKRRKKIDIKFNAYKKKMHELIEEDIKKALELRR